MRATLPCDVQRLLDCLDAGDLPCGVALYTGAFLAGVHLPDWSGLLEDWVYDRRAIIAQRVRRSLLTLGERAAARGEFAQAGSLAEQAYFLTGAPAPSGEAFERLLLLLTAGQSVLLGQAQAAIQPP